MRCIWIIAAIVILAGPAMAIVQVDSAAGVIDTVPPTVAVLLDDPTPTALDAVHFSVDFSEPVGATFSASDVALTGSLSGAAALGVSGTDPNYTVTVTMNNPEEDGTLGIQIGTGVTDLVGNACAGGVSGLYQISNGLGPLAILQSPQNARAYAGEPHTFTVETTGGVLPLQYQWRKDGAVIPAATDSSYTIGSVGSSNAGNYSVIVNDANNASETSGDGALAVAAHLQITSPPASAHEVVGAAHTFTVATSGGFAPLSYVWKKNGVEIGAATNASYTTPPLTPADSATFTVDVSDSYSDIRTASADLTVIHGAPVAGVVGLAGLLGLISLTGVRRMRNK